MKRRTALAAASAFAAAPFAPRARAAGATTSIVFGYTAVSDFASVFVAADEGYFKKRNLEVELKLIPLNATIPAALQSDSLQIGGPTPSVFLQAVDGGLDLVTVAGGGMTSQGFTGFGLVARAGSGIRTAKDCVGKKVGVPGLGAFLHVTFRAWLKLEGVDDKQVTFVEASFPQHADLLRGGSIDAVVTADPILSRIVESGAGRVVSYYGTFLPEGNPTTLHAAKREWAEKNAAAVRAFHEAIVEAAAYIKQPKNDASVRAAIGHYIKLPPPVLAKMQITVPGAIVTDKQLAYWVGLMKEQGMLKGEPKVASLVFK